MALADLKSVFLPPMLNYDCCFQWQEFEPSKLGRDRILHPRPNRVPFRLLSCHLGKVSQRYIWLILGMTLLRCLWDSFHLHLPFIIEIYL